MIVTPFEFAIRSEDFSEADGTRSPGLHLSQVIRDLDEVRLGRSRYPDGRDQVREAYFSVGFLWERVLSQLWRETAEKTRAGQLIRPGELQLEGIAMSPDAIDLEDYVLEEYKATWMSSGHDILDPRFWPWIVQIKCYCKALGTRRARLRVFHVGGDWKGEKPQVKGWTFEFTDRDVEEVWEMVVNHARWRQWI